MRNSCLVLVMSCFLISCSENKKNEKSESDSSGSVGNEVTQEAAKAQDTETPKGLTLIKGSDCTACHMQNQKLVGPSYEEVALKYKDNSDAPAQLVKNIMEGATGVWGEIPMPGHPQLTQAEVAEMVDYILSLK